MAQQSQGWLPPQRTRPGLPWIVPTQWTRPASPPSWPQQNLHPEAQPHVEAECLSLPQTQNHLLPPGPPPWFCLL